MILLTDFFKIEEFNRNGENWYDKYDPRWLVMIDIFRLHTGVCELSPHPRALGRRDGNDPNKTGFDGHNIDKHGLVYAGDVFPFLGKDEYTSIFNAYSIAKRTGFTGVGIYPQWTKDGKRRCGMHLDTRRTITLGGTAEWGFVDGKFVPVKEALNSLKQYR